MSAFPVTIGDTAFDSVDALVEHIRHRAHHAVPRNPNDGQPVQSRGRPDLVVSVLLGRDPGNELLDAVRRLPPARGWSCRW